MINEVEFLKRCEKIREEIIHCENVVSKLDDNHYNLDDNHYNKEFINGKIVGLRFCYDIMKQNGIYK
jgi:hypothetical protein